MPPLKVLLRKRSASAAGCASLGGCACARDSASPCRPARLPLVPVLPVPGRPQLPPIRALRSPTDAGRRFRNCPLPFRLAPSCPHRGCRLRPASAPPAVPSRSRVAWQAAPPGPSLPARPPVARSVSRRNWARRANFLRAGLAKPDPLLYGFVRLQDIPAPRRCHPAILQQPVPPACAPVAQLDRAPDYESGGQEFESLRARHFSLLR